MRQGSDFRGLPGGQDALGRFAPQWVHESLRLCAGRAVPLPSCSARFAANVLFRRHARRPHMPSWRPPRAYGMSPPPDLLARAWCRKCGSIALPGLAQPVDGADQGDAAVVPAGRSKTSSTGRASWAGPKRPRFTDFPAPRLAHVVLSRPAGVLPDASPSVSEVVLGPHHARGSRAARPPRRWRSPKRKALT